MDDKGDDVTVALREAVNEGFGWFLRQMTDREINDGSHAFLKIKWTFKVAFLKGVIWTKRQSREQAKLPRT